MMSYSKFYHRSNELWKNKVHEQELKAGEKIVNQGETATKVTLLLKGKVKVVHQNSNGDEFIIGFFEQEEFFGHLECLNGEKYVATVQCLTDCTVAVMPGEAYTQWFKTDPEFAFFVHKGLSSHVLNDSRRIVENNFFPLEYHILKYIIEESEHFTKLSIQFSRNELAAYTGTQLRSVNRILKSLVDDQVIQIEKSELRILDKVELEQRFMRNI